MATSSVLLNKTLHNVCTMHQQPMNGLFSNKSIQGALNAAKHGLDTSGLCSGSGGLWDGFGREVFQGLGVSYSVIQRLLERFQTMYRNKLHGRPTE